MRTYQYIDPSVLFKSVAHDLESFRDLSATFLEIAPPMFERLERAVLAGDSKATAHESHALKGTTALLGAVQLTSVLQDIESRSRNADQHGVAPFMPELARLFKQVMQEVEASIAHFQGEAGTSRNAADRARRP